MTSPAQFRTQSSNRPSPQREGRTWRFVIDGAKEPREVWGRIKLEDGWAMVVDTDADGIGFVVFASPATAVLSVESVPE